MGLILPIWVTLYTEYHHQPLFFTLPSKTPSRDMYVHKTFPTVTPPQNTPYPGLNKMNELPSGQNGPQLGKMFEMWANFFWKWAKK